MEIKEGYKLTEIGIIPEDWEVKRVSDFARVVRGGSPRPAGDSKYFNGKFIPWLTVASLTNISAFQSYVSETEGFLTETGSKFSRILEKETIIIANSGATLGVSKLLSIKCCANDGIAALLSLPTDFNKLFIVSYINTLTIFLRKVVATGNGQPNLNTGLIGNILVPIPKGKEQNAVAKIFNDTDALIVSLERLIEKKEEIKQGTTQLLLSGKKRLHGFKNQWKIKRLDKLFTFLNTANNSRSELSDDGEVGYIHYGDIHTKWKNFLDCAKTQLPGITLNKVKNIPFLMEGDLILADASEDYEGIGVCVEVRNLKNKQIVAGLHTILLRGNKNYVADGFKGFFRELPGVKNALIRIATGISVFGISKTQLKSIEVNLPSVEEQEAIAQVLSDMDAEIEQLQRKLSKYKIIKQGMMQNLLTGKIRLV